MKRSLFLASLVILPLLATAVPVEREVGNGLLYYRVHKLPDDLPGKPAGRVGPSIIDVRYVNADANAAAVLFTWLKNRATSRTPVFVIANADTSPALLKVISGNPRGAGIAVVGIARGGFRPDVAVKGSAEDERRAYDALEKGAMISTLLTDNPDKVRNDEASLSKDRLAEASADAANDAGKKESPPIDVALQRAVHLHRALVALKKI
jgi:hypothetical protein